MITKHVREISHSKQETELRSVPLGTGDDVRDMLSELACGDGERVRNLSIAAELITFDIEAILEGGYWGHRYAYSGDEEEMKPLVRAAHNLQWTTIESDFFKPRRVVKKSLHRAVLAALELGGKTNATAAEKLEWQNLFIAKRLADNINFPFAETAELLVGPGEWKRVHIAQAAMMASVSDIARLKLALELEDLEDFEAALELFYENNGLTFEEAIALAK